MNDDDFKVLSNLSAPYAPGVQKEGEALQERKRDATRKQEEGVYRKLWMDQGITTIEQLLYQLSGVGWGGAERSREKARVRQIERECEREREREKQTARKNERENQRRRTR